jgi:arylsulfatase A-like enzyme
MIVGDTVRADHLSCYGYSRNTSPAIDSLAGEGVLFEDFYSGGCPTGPGFTCLYTGLHSIRHKYYQFGSPNVRQVDDKIFTLPEIMRAMGYTTVAFDNLMNVMQARAKHFVRGYDIYVNCGPEPFDHAHFLKAERLNGRLIPWIEHSLEEPFFLFVHYWDPHMPYNQPDSHRDLYHHEPGDWNGFKVRSAPAGYDYVPGWGRLGEIAEGELPAIYGPHPTMSIDLYDGEIRYMDDAIGQLLEALGSAGVMDRTAVVFTADHGEQLHQHKGYGWEHGGLHDADTHLPLVIRYPEKLPAGTRATGFCQQIDILPTIVELAGFSAAALTCDGESALPLLGGKKLRETIFMEHSGGQRALRTEEWKYLDNAWLESSFPRRELFNVKNDPMEVIDLVEQEPEVSRRLAQELESWVDSHLQAGEEDPAHYDQREIRRERSEYRESVEQLLKSLGK